MVEILPSCVLYGAKLSDKEQSNVLECLGTFNNAEADSVTYRALNGGESQTLADIVATHNEWAETELGISMQNRSLPFENIRIYDDVAFLELQKALDLEPNDRREGRYQVKGNRVFVRETDQLKLLHTCTHEFVHSQENLRCYVRRNKNDVPINIDIRYGYGFDGLGSFLTEAVTELISLTVLYKYSAKYKKMSFFEVDPSYPSIVYLLGEVCERVASREGISGKAVMNELYYGYYAGNMDGLRRITKHFGKNALVQLSNVSTKEDALEVAECLGIPSFIERVNTGLIRL